MNTFYPQRVLARLREERVAWYDVSVLVSFILPIAATPLPAAFPDTKDMPYYKANDIPDGLICAIVGTQERSGHSMRYLSHRFGASGIQDRTG
ncbi:MAG: hypothetical protein CL581_08015 [Alteromonadaceae bacterium]|nr:hypothetical protein [Alteromonadaceae bacterium]MBH84592.1 hypothetical protein [Alteromonadaceae bacterium]|tara:strand:+ start:198 stop:476 length:279 start_codon:yes stop_codon:yes gene_type:complete